MLTFDDDPLRILRAFRFASQLNFEVDNSINEAAFKLTRQIKNSFPGKDHRRVFKNIVFSQAIDWFKAAFLFRCYGNNFS